MDAGRGQGEGKFTNINILKHMKIKKDTLISIAAAIAVFAMVGGGIYFMLQFKMMTETPVLKEYAARITARPAFKKMMERDTKK